MASHLPNHNGAPPSLAPRRSSHICNPSVPHMPRAHTQLDEGYSEETRSISDSEMVYSESANAANLALLADVLNLPVEQRKQLAEALVRTLPNPDKEDIGDLCERLTKFDPVFTIPNELMLQVLSYLSPKDLLTCSVISRAWRQRAHDERLWRGCFAREGWLVDTSKMESFEERAKRKAAKTSSSSTRRPGLDLERRGSRKRKTEEAFSEGEAAAQGNASDASSDSMEGVETAIVTSSEDTVRAGEGNSSGSAMSTTDALMDFDNRRSSTDSAASMNHNTRRRASSLQISPPLFRAGSDHPKLSWPYLYKQRCKLEKNWEKGAYKMFQLPHPRHPNEGHEECVYTIQHTSRHLVSGSRDKTIRIWDLDTYRLARNPLRGHEASVLCLQFDERPEHDIIVSGGSDSFVIVWKFSTGEIIKKMTQAHDESVLNLRFDDRYIVTCSKDKFIKVWNRRALHRDDPLVPAHVIPKLDNINNPLLEGNMIKEYSMLTKLEGHQAAVNAVMVRENTIVSASGDRTIKSWDINTGTLNKTYIGHTKGIACVQFDGRRIVSGSSDNTVRIFDAENQAEIACLNSHNNLVRTVQARFGDLDTITDEELEDEARKADRDFFRALENGMQPASASRHSRRNAGSARPENMLSIGTKVPPGGGGSRWAKIVSGSYDELVKIWKRDREGNWDVVQVLHQGMLLNSRTGRHTNHRAIPQPLGIHAINAQAGPNNVDPAQQVQHALQQAQGHVIQANHLLQQPLPPNMQIPPSQMAGLTATQVTLGNHIAQAGNQQQQQHGHAHAAAAPPHPVAFGLNPHAQLANAAPHPPPLAGPAAAAAAAPPNAPHAHIHHHHHHPAAPAGAAAGAAAAAAGAAGPVRQHHDSNRVFKLQFDARRIICCSQNKVIVGWDFANGDKELERIGGWSVETA